MTNKERQKWLDKRKWVDSELVKRDMSGEYLHCDYCKHQKFIRSDKHECTASQQEREINCLCAVAYNKFYRR